MVDWDKAPGHETDETEASSEEIAALWRPYESLLRIAAARGHP